MKIYKYSVEIFRTKVKENVFKTEQFEVGLENDNLIVLKDESFTKLNKKKSKYSTDISVDDEHIYERKWGGSLADYDGIQYILYTYKVKKPETIRKQIENWISDKYGYLFNINLDFIINGTKV